MSTARRWSWLLVLVVGYALYDLVRRTTVATGNPNFLPALILLGAAVVPAAFVAFVAGRRLRFDIGGGLVAGTALIGGVIGVVTAGLLEFHTLQRLGVLPMVAVGLIEEAAKLVVPIVLVVVLRRHRHPADGLLLGVACGAGFAVLETMGYAFVVLVRSNGDLEVVQQVLFLRGVLSPAAHMAWTGLAAAALFTAAAQRWHARAVGRFLAVFAVVVTLHTLWDSLASTLWADIVVAVVSLALLTWTAHSLAAPRRRGLPRETVPAVR